LIEREILDRIETQGIDAQHRKKIDHRRSVLLFGPPGTSKTSLVRAIAEKIGWPLVELNPSDFLKEGLENIYSQANKIFEDLKNLWRTVVFFDEMDALAQKREEGIDVTRQFLTTSMLPKLSMLHDEARVLFFMATNHQRNFDEAIKRPGRFDLLICMAPPLWIEKIKELEKFWTGTKVEGMWNLFRRGLQSGFLQITDLLKC
jgi:SpoVK/Ycf46/Vps4 family AAA+-type ATPase